MEFTASGLLWPRLLAQSFFAFLCRLVRADEGLSRLLKPEGSPADWIDAICRGLESEGPSYMQGVSADQDWKSGNTRQAEAGPQILDTGWERRC